MITGKPIIITGMFRGGTSAVAQALSYLGVYFGREEDLFPADEHNEAGYWENKKINDLNRRFLMTLNLAAFDVDPMPKKWLELPYSGAYIDEMCSLLKSQFSGKGIWGWKDPETSVLIPFTKEVMKRLGVLPHYVICVRNPLDVAASAQKRSGDGYVHTLGTWIRRTLGVLMDSIGEERTIIIHERFLEDPRASLLPLVSSVPDLHPDESSWKGASVSVRKDLSHSQESIEELVSLPSLFSRTLIFCRKAADYLEALNSGEFDSEIIALWSEMNAWRDLMHPANPPASRFTLFWQQGTKSLQANCEFAPTRQWQTLRLIVPCARGVSIVAMLYYLPAVIWIRKAVWNVGGNAVPIDIRGAEYGNVTIEQGLKRVGLAHGVDQIAFDAPAMKGPFELEIELLLEMNQLITGMTFRQLTSAWDQARQAAAGTESS